MADTPLQRLWLFLLVLLASILFPLALPSEFFGSAIRMLGLQPDESFFWGNAILGLVCIAPVFYAVSRAPTFGFASLLGVVFGAISTGLSNFWLMFFQGYSIWSYGGTVLGYAGYNALLFPFLRGFSLIDHRARPFLLAAAWAVYEYFKSVGFLGYPWGLIAYPVGDFLPLIQFIDITGIWGLSFLMALVNALVAEWALAGWRPLFVRQAGAGLVLVLCALGYGLYRLSVPIPHETTASLLLVQQNMDPWVQGSGKADSIKTNTDLTVEGVRSSTPRPDLAVWSESSVSSVGVTADHHYMPADNSLVPSIQKTGVPILFGGVGIVDLDKQFYTNSSILAAADGRVVDTYGKMHPVPFAESVPFFEYPAVQQFFRKVVGIWNVWVSGTRYTIYTVPLAAGGSMEFGTPICFEDAFSNLCRGFITRGADLLINITNDSWSKTWSSEIQHFQVARFRAVENRRVLVRSTNGGLSGVVGPWGEIRLRMPFFVSTWRAVQVPVYREARLTPYTRFGDWFPFALMIVLMAVLVANVLPTTRAALQRRAPLQNGPS